MASRDAARIDPPGEQISIGGAVLQAYCSCPDGAPMIILENGMGVVSDAWARVQVHLDDSYRVCRYDRAGTGHSAAFEGPKDAGASADRLAVVIKTLDLDEPMIVAGHSYGGLIARVFADRHREKTAGVVLVDSSHEVMGEWLPPEGQALIDDILRAFSMLKTANRFCGLRLVGPPAPW